MSQIQIIGGTPHYTCPFCKTPKSVKQPLPLYSSERANALYDYLYDEPEAQNRHSEDENDQFNESQHEIEADLEVREFFDYSVDVIPNIAVFEIRYRGGHTCVIKLVSFDFMFLDINGEFLPEIPELDFPAIDIALQSYLARELDRRCSPYVEDRLMNLGVATDLIYQTVCTAHGNSDLDPFDYINASVSS